jgi:hypothetical protein
MGARRKRRIIGTGRPTRKRRDYLLNRPRFVNPRHISSLQVTNWQRPVHFVTSTQVTAGQTDESAGDRFQQAAGRSSNWNLL